MKTLIICKSTHHGNTEKVARRVAETIGADLIVPEEFQGTKGYDLIGFGSGIYFSRHHKKLFNLIDGMTSLEGKKVFIFSTAGMIREINHRSLREKLEEKGAKIVDEFSCAGHDTYSILKYMGGINKGRPNKEDLKEAEDFAKDLIKKL